MDKLREFWENQSTTWKAKNQLQILYMSELIHYQTEDGEAEVRLRADIDAIVVEIEGV